MEGPLIALVVIAVLATPIAAIYAVVQLRALQQRLSGFDPQAQIARIYALERKLGELEKAAASGNRGYPEGFSSQVEWQESQEAGKGAPAVASLRVPLPGETSATPDREAGAAPPPPLVPLPSLSSAALGDRGKLAGALDLENWIGARGLNRVGIVAVIAAVSFFLKYAFDNNWIGPAGRVAIGALLGAAMLPFSQWLLKRGYSYFSEGIAGMGAAVLYLSIWAGCQFYTLYSRDMGFVAMILVSAAMAAIALGRNSQRIALLSLAGGFLTPVLVSSGQNAEVVLFLYLLALGAGMLVMDVMRDWRVLGPLSFIATQIFFWGWYGDFYKTNALEITVLFATLFFAMYAAVPLWRAFRKAELDGIDLPVVVATAAAYFAALWVLLWPRDRWTLTLFTLALAAAYVAIARIVPAAKAGETPVARMIYAGLALTFATLVIPVRLDDKWMTIGFAVEGAALVFAGVRARTELLRHAGHLLLTIAGIRVLLFVPVAPTFILNWRFGIFVAFIACLAAAVYVQREIVVEESEPDKILLGVMAVAINVYALLALSMELWDYFGRHGAPGVAAGFAQHLALSLLWTGYATVLILIGVKQHLALLRWQALALYGLVVLKVFLYDSSYLERFYRIVAFLILGLVLLAVSFFYQRKMREHSVA